MNRLYAGFILFAIGLMVGLPVRGQDAPNDPPPKPPYFKFPEKIAFTATVNGVEVVQGADQSKEAASQLARVDVVRVGDIAKIVKVYANGRKLEEWDAGEVRASQSPEGNWINVNDKIKHQLYQIVQYSAEDWSWINAECFVGRVKYKDRDCYRYKLERGELADVPMGSYRELEALIDAQTLYPLVLRFDSTLVTLAYRQAPQAALTIPDRFRDEIRKTVKQFR